MNLSTKDYKIKKTKSCLKTCDLLFFVNGINRNSLDWLLAEQGLKAYGFNYYKVLNKTTIKALNSSIYTKLDSAVKGSTFFMDSQQKTSFLKQIILNTFAKLFFELLIFKFNNKIYSIDCLKNTQSLNYKETQLLLYKFSLIYVKSCYRISK